MLVSTSYVEGQYLIFLSSVAKRGESEGDFRPSQLRDSPPQRFLSVSKPINVSYIFKYGTGLRIHPQNIIIKKKKRILRYPS